MLVARKSVLQAQADQLKSQIVVLQQMATRVVDDEFVRTKVAHLEHDAVRALADTTVLHDALDLFIAKTRRDSRRRLLVYMGLSALFAVLIAAAAGLLYLEVALGMSLARVIATSMVGGFVGFGGMRVHTLDAVAKALWSKKTYDRVFKPARADLIREWKDAIRSKETFRAWWINCVRGPFTILEMLIRQLPWSLIRKIASVFSEFSK